MGVDTHRRRVQRALDHEEPDRVPLDLMGNASMLLDETYVRLRDYLGLAPIAPFRSGTSANYYDERILSYLDIDFRRVFLKPNPQANTTQHVDGSYTDPWGIRYQKAGLFVNILRHPLAGMTSVTEVDAYRWPAAEEMFVVGDLTAEARHLYSATDYALVARNPLSYGFLDRAVQMMGMSEFMMNLALNPDVAQAIIRHLLEVYCDVFRMFLDAVGPYVQMVEIGDDLGTQQSLLISTAMYRRFVKPVERELYSLIHAKAPSAALFRHTDGAVFSLIPDLIEVGVNVLNPVQTSARGMEAKRLKQTFGQQLTFHGAVEGIEGDVSVDQVVVEVKHLIDVLGASGGYIVSSCNHMIDVQPQNIVAMFETARAYRPNR